MFRFQLLFLEDLFLSFAFAFSLFYNTIFDTPFLPFFFILDADKIQRAFMSGCV